MAIVAGMVVMVPVIQVTIAGVFRANGPALVQRVAPFDALSAASLAYGQAMQGRGSQLVRADALAATALRRDPTAVQAVVARGLIADQQGNHAMARRWFGYADRLSKRNLATQLWFIEDRVQAGDVPGVLARYDLALRATPSANVLLFPIMAQAASIPEVGGGLHALLRTRPVWGSSFVSHLIKTSTDSAAVVRVTTGIINRDPVNGRDQITALVSRLIANGRYDLAWRAYQAFNRHRNESATVRDGNFAETASVSAFEWAYPEAPSLSPDHGEEGGRPVLYLPANPDQDGEVAKQLVRLEGGRWRLSARVGAAQQAPVDAPRLRVTCAGAAPGTPAAPLIDLAFPRSSSPSTLAGTFVAPANCGYAWLSIAVRQPSEPVPGTGPFITDVTLSRG